MVSRATRALAGAAKFVQNNKVALLILLSVAILLVFKVPLGLCSPPLHSTARAVYRQTDSWVHTRAPTHARSRGARIKIVVQIEVPAFVGVRRRLRLPKE